MAKDPLDEILAKPAVISHELTEKEKLDIEKEVEAEIAKELKAEKRKEFKAAAKQRLKKTALFSLGKDEEGEDTEVVLIQLASQAAEIILDGKRYIHGRAYRVSQNVAATMKEIMFRGEKHDAEIHGKKMADFYGTRPRNPQTGSSVTLSPNGAQQEYR